MRGRGRGSYSIAVSFRKPVSMATAQTDGRFICQSHMPLVRDIVEQCDAEWRVTCLYRLQLFPFPVHRNCLTVPLQRKQQPICHCLCSCKNLIRPLLARSWRQCVPRKRRFVINPHGATSQKTEFFFL
jgi:hypothetical protein